MDSEKRVLHSEDPIMEEKDVLLIVGGTEYQESSHFLCYWSEYFAAAFRSGMKEEITKRFVFPHRDPEEWSQLKDTLNPFHKDHATWTNIDSLLPFASELGIRKLINHADTLVFKIFPRRNFDGQFSCDPYYAHKTIKKMLKALSLIHQYNLKRCRPMVFNYIEECWSRRPCIFWDNCEELFEILAENKDLRDRLWYLIRPYVPSKMKSLSHEEILRYPLRLQARYHYKNKHRLQCK